MAEICARCEVELEDRRRRLCPKCSRRFKWCPRCERVRSLRDFYVRANGKRTGYCKQCHYAHIRRPEALEARQEYFYRYHLRRKFGISEQEADRLASIAACECCGAPRGAERLHVDHHHGDGQIRGVVCRRCNYAIAVLEEEGLVGAVTKYLSRRM